MPSTPADTMGVLDMGGASTQMTFVPKNGTGIPPQHRTNFRLYGASYTVYTNSFLCYGLKESGRRHFALLAKVSYKVLPTTVSISLISDTIKKWRP